MNQIIPKSNFFKDKYFDLRRRIMSQVLDRIINRDDQFSLQEDVYIGKSIKFNCSNSNFSSDMNESFIDLIPQKIWTASAEGKINYFNKRWLEYTGLSIRDLEYDGWFRTVHPDDLMSTIDAWSCSIASGKDIEVINRLKNKNGNYYWHITKGAVQKNGLGQPIKWIGTTTYIENQKRSEAQKEEFIGIASHELKTPLTTLKAYLQLVSRSIDRTSCDEQTIHYLEKANSYISRLNDLIANLLDISSMQMGKLKLNRSNFDLNIFVSDVIGAVQLTTRHRIIKEGDLSPILIYGDRLRLEQVIINYITNAIKYSPNADRIFVRIIKETDRVIVAITDLGIGVPFNIVNKVFDRFFRAENTAQKFSGFGIGLHISAEIIKQHGGIVWVKSEEGKGSTFYFSLPNCRIELNPE